MPELPEVENIRKSLEGTIRDKRITKVEIFYPKVLQGIRKEGEVLKGKVFSKILRRGKYLLFLLEPSGVLLCHLRMTGKFRYQEAIVPQKHDHLVFMLDKGWLIYNDVRKFGGLVYYDNIEEAWESLRHLGKEPLSEEFTAEYLYQKSRGKKKALKAFLLDQSVVAGIGNIYADEVLFRAKLNPTKPSLELTKEACEMLVFSIKMILEDAITSGGSSIQNYSNAIGQKGKFQEKHEVYARSGQPCKVCQNILEKTQVAGRTTTYCSKCQK